jgi:hypothetical protein
MITAAFVDARSGATAGSSSSASFGCHCWRVQQCFATAENCCGRVSHCCAQVSRPRTSLRPQVSRSSKLLHDSGEETCAERGHRTGLQARSVSAWLRDVNRHPIATAGRASSGTRLPSLLDEPAVARGYPSICRSVPRQEVSLASRSISDELRGASSFGPSLMVLRVTQTQQQAFSGFRCFTHQGSPHYYTAE